MFHKKNKNNITEILIPPDKISLTKAYKLVIDRDIRIVDLANVIIKDPILTLEVLKAGNASATLDGRPETTSLTSAITRLGFDSMQSLLFGLQSRKPPNKSDIITFFNKYQKQSVNMSQIAYIFAKHISNKMIEPAKIGALFLNIGYILTLLHFKDKFIELAQNISPALLRFKIEKELDVNVEKIVLKYLRRYSIPENLIETLNRDATFSQSERHLVLTRAIIQSAREITVAFDENKISTYKPGNAIPSKSYIRILPLVGEQYNKIFEESIGYLTQCRIESLREEKSEAHCDENTLE